ncbi:transcriptional regulator domain-containing protein [Rhodomicrobium vannielii]|uniref:transcriptional regulator domain-containing protein n=1 Tax=Rhodomicrobium vannielii TaxID=1069 RepID=UPI003D7C2097
MLHSPTGALSLSFGGIKALEPAMPIHTWPPSLDSYDYLVGQPQSAWAWEFLRRNSHYRAQAEQALQGAKNPSQTRTGLRITRLLSPQLEANAWALCSFRRSKPGVA